MTEPWFTFPDIDPIAIQLGPLAIRWYALAYIIGLVLAWRVLAKQAKTADAPFTSLQLDKLLNMSLLGIIAGGRLGYVLAYNPAYFISHPLDILKIWEGGMSFHGGFVGVILAVIYVSRRHNLRLLAVADRVASVAPIGLFTGRLANFINGELYGRVTELPIGIIFPHGGPHPRHPSQLYEAALEGVLLLVCMWLFVRRGAYYWPGFLTGLFLFGYGLSRWMVEYVRQPDSHIGFVFEIGQMGITMGQILCLPMIAMGIYALHYGWSHKNG